jgi:hypothetical protein
MSNADAFDREPESVRVRWRRSERDAKSRREGVGDFAGA